MNTKIKGLQTSIYLAIAYVCNCDTKKAKELYNIFGNNYIYAGGTAIIYNEKRVRNILTRCGKICIIDNDGNVDIHTRKGTKKHNSLYNDDNELCEYIAQKKKERKTKEIFNAGRTLPTSKKCRDSKSINKIGKYIHVQGRTINKDHASLPIYSWR